MPSQSFVPIQVNLVKRPNDPGNETKTASDKRQKMDDNLISGHQMSDEARWLLKIIECKICQHFTRHPDALGPLVIGNVPNIIRPCVKRECSHKCTHMSEKIANLLIINCNELQHLCSQMMSNKLELNIAEEVNDDPYAYKWTKCTWKNCSKKCSHMISAQVIQR